MFRYNVVTDCNWWTKHEGGHRLGGRYRAVGNRSVEDCKKECLMYSPCTGVDYLTSADGRTVGKLACFLHGSWSGKIDYSDHSQGANHYSLVRTCVDPGNKFKSFSHNY